MNPAAAQRVPPNSPTKAILLPQPSGKYHGRGGCIGQADAGMQRGYQRVLRVYNATCTAAYESEVIRAYQQAHLFETSSLTPDKFKH